MKEVLDEITVIMQQIYGKEISIYDEDFLLKSLERRRQITGCERAVDYSNYLAKNRIEAEALYNSLRIIFSQFFREPLTFAILEQRILPSIIYQKKESRKIRVWSAGCAGGQEAYSIAILLNELAIKMEKKISFQIFATDISQLALTEAKAGQYTREAVQNLQLQQIDKYFTQQGETYRVINRLKESIDFTAYDLLDLDSANPQESIYGDFDIIFCNNLLFYYKPEFRRIIIGKLERSLANSGYLVTTETESTYIEAVSKLKPLIAAAPIFQKYIR